MENFELKELRDKIIEFNRQYEKGTPIVDDAVYDFYKKKLAILENHEKIKISEYVGSFAHSDPVPHLFPILSLDHDFGKDSILKFLKKIEKVTDPFPLVAELKIDGVSVVAKYENGLITNLKTRGNGYFGENISHLIPYLNIPNSIYLNETLEIRFEAFFDKNTVTNPRNAASGILFKKNPDKNLAFLRFAPHNLYSTQNLWESYSDLRQLFANIHLDCIHPFAICHSLDDCIEYFKKIELLKNDLSHEIDGIVFKVNDKIKQNLLGNTSKSPKFAFAIKFTNSFNISEITNIEFQVGRQGKVTPLAIITTTEIHNRKISKATLNNLNDLKDKGYSVGDIIKIEMAGEVIPKITEVIEKSKNITAIPTTCPSCNSTLKEDICSKEWDCFQQKLNKLIYFASKSCLDIQNLGENQIEFFVLNNILNRPFDFFELKHNINKIQKKPNWLAEKYFYKMVKSIEKSSYTTLEKFITSIGLPNIAKTKAKKIADNFENFENFMNSEIVDLNFLGENNAKAVYNYKEKERLWIQKTASYLKFNQIYRQYSLFNF